MWYSVISVQGTDIAYPTVAWMWYSVISVQGTDIAYPTVAWMWYSVISVQGTDIAYPTVAWMWYSVISVQGTDIAYPTVAWMWYSVISVQGTDIAYPTVAWMWYSVISVQGTYIAYPPWEVFPQKQKPWFFRQTAFCYCWRIFTCVSYNSWRCSHHIAEVMVIVQCSYKSGKPEKSGKFPFFCAEKSGNTWKTQGNLEK